MGLMFCFRYTFQDGSWYAGDWDKGKKHGKGLLHFGDGTIFDGSFEADQIHGLVVMLSPDGEWTKSMASWYQIHGLVVPNPWPRGHAIPRLEITNHNRNKGLGFSKWRQQISNPV